MSQGIISSARCAVARWGTQPVGFIAVCPQPGVKERGLSYAQSRICWRESRVVVLPEMQGLGIGPMLSNATGARFVSGVGAGKPVRYISRTAHPRFGEYRERSPLWEPTSTNRTANEAMYSKKQREQLQAAAKENAPKNSMKARS